MSQSTRLDTPVKPAAPTFQEKLDALAGWLCGGDDADLAGLGAHLGELAEEVRALDAASWEQFVDRRSALRGEG